jgi:pimeloyl-ACP methyl ester carboxylesterase
MSERNIPAPSNLLLLTELGRGFLNLGTYFATMPLINFTPRGDGHPVLVLPGFLTNDNATIPLRYFLNWRNYNTQPWEMGRNLVNYEGLERKLEDRVKTLADKAGKKVSLVGWSAGGLFARALAHNLKDYVRQVITLGSPFQGIQDKSNVEFMLEWVTGKKVNELEDVILERASQLPPVPTTAVYTRLDGIVHWKTCIDYEETPTNENVEVFASHLGLGFDPMTLVCVADRLSQPEGKWKPLKETKLGQSFYNSSWQNKA